MIPFLHGALGVAGYASDYELIETQTVGAGGAASITFSSIPGSYKHLQLRATTRSTSSFALTHLQFQFNSDTGGTSYQSYHFLDGNGTAATSTAGATSSSAWIVNTSAGSTAAANIFGVGIIDILDYANTSKNKVLRGLAASDQNGSGNVTLTSSMWLSTAAITSIKLLSYGGNFAQYSTLALYGVK